MPAKDPWTFLYSCECGQSENIETLLKGGECDITITNYDYENGLMLAAGASHHQVVKTLLDTGAYDLDDKNAYDESTLMIAASRGCHHISTTIIRERKDDEGDVSITRRQKRSKTVDHIIDGLLKQHPHSSSFHRATFDVLMYACKEDRLSLLKALIATGRCDLGEQDAYASTLLVYAHSPRIIRELTANHTYSDEQIQKALWSAYRLGRPTVMRYLIDNLGAHSHHPIENPEETFKFRDTILASLFVELSKKNRVYAEIKSETDQLLAQM